MITHLEFFYSKSSPVLFVWILLAYLIINLLASDIILAQNAETPISNHQAFLTKTPSIDPIDSSLASNHINTPFLQIFNLKLSTKMTLRYGLYSPDLKYYQSEQIPSPQSIILFIPGRGGWVEQYEDLFFLLYQNLQTPIVVVDNLGQGKSDGVRGHIDHYDQYSQSYLEVLNDLFGQQIPPYSIIAHSAGGLMALYSSMTGTLNPEKIILSAPMIRMRSKPIPGYIAHPISFFASVFGLSQKRSGVKSEKDYQFEENRLTNNRYRFEILSNHPYPLPSPSFGWLNASFHAQNYIHSPKALKNLTADVMIFYGEHEKVVSTEGIENWIRLAEQSSNSNQVIGLLIKNAKHELFYETDQIIEMILKKIYLFID